MCMLVLTCTRAVGKGGGEDGEGVGYGVHRMSVGTAYSSK